MHSSLINKIRILKPRKKVAPPQQNVKSFTGTINNDNCHSSIMVQGNKDDMPPPLETAKNIEMDSEQQKSKWVPFYVVNVSKVGGDLKTSLEPGINKASTSSENNPDTNLEKVTTTGRRLFVHVPSQSTNLSADNTFFSQVRSGGTSTDAITSVADNPNISKSVVSPSKRVTRQRPGKGTHSVNCFLCPTKFHSVQAMQDHYLESHKHKKRTSLNNTKPLPKKMVKSSARIKDPLMLTEGDCATGDGEPKCPICSIYFKTKDEVKSHMTSVHCYKCSECHNTFYTLFQFTDHRCAKFVKQKKPKLKKKKLKIASPPKQSSETELEQDPLLIAPNKFIKIWPKNVPILPKTSSYPLIIHYPSETPPQSSLPVSTENSNNIQMSNEQHKNNSTTVTAPSLSSLPSLVSITDTQVSKNTSIAQIANTKTKSLLNFSLEELTSKEFNKMKLDEITKNPHLSISWIPKKNHEEPCEEEFFSCGRCNVLCEDKIDYVEHLEECLRLSNVSLLSTPTPPQRILKLKSEIIPPKPDKLTKTTINKNLLKELKGFMGSQVPELFNYDEENVVNLPDNKIPEQKSDDKTSSHPDIKGNISITRLKSTSGQGNNHYKTLISSTKPTQAEIPSPMIMTQALKYPASVSSHTPMVIIPINRSFPGGGQIPAKEIAQDDPDYPNISITDKSNSVTWNFIGSETGAVLSVQPPGPVSDGSKSESLTPTDIKVNPETLPSSTLNVRNSSVPPLPVNSSSSVHETEFIKMKSEPSSPLGLESSGSPLSGEYKDHAVSMELVLDEDEIKMEVEDEVVDNRF